MAGVRRQPVNWDKSPSKPRHVKGKVPNVNAAGKVGGIGSELTLMVGLNAVVVPVVTTVAGPGDSAIGVTRLYPGGAVPATVQSPERRTGAVPVTILGKPVMSAGLSDSRMRRLTLLK